MLQDQWPLQQPPDRRRREQRPLRSGGLCAARRIWPTRSRSASPRSRSCSSSSRRTTCARETSPEAASTPSPRAGPTPCAVKCLYMFRNQDWVGNGVDDRPIATFSDKQFGGSIGGPMARNRAFFFGNVEWQRRETPSGWSVDGSSGRSSAARPTSSACSTSPSPATGTIRAPSRNSFGGNPNDKVFVRGDFNLSSSHQLTVRHNYIDAVQRHRHASPTPATSSLTSSTSSPATPIRRSRS